MITSGTAIFIVSFLRHGEQARSKAEQKKMKALEKKIFIPRLFGWSHMTSYT